VADEREAMDRLGRYWDALAAGTSSGQDDVDPTVAETIDHFHRLGTAPPPRSPRERVWRDVRASIDTRSPAKEVSMQATVVFGQARVTVDPNGRTDPRPRYATLPPLPRERNRGIGAWLTAAVVLLVVLSGAVVVDRFGLPGSDDGDQFVLPAAQATTPATGPVEFLWQTSGDSASPMENALYLAIDPQGNIWVPDGQNGRFQIFSPDGALLEVWGTKGEGEGQFEFVAAGFSGYGQGAIAFDAAGNFYVADTGNHRIQKFAPDRTFLTAWGSLGREDGQFMGATDVAVDDQGRVFVVDATRTDLPSAAQIGAVQVFDENGGFLTAWGDRGDEPGQLSSPMGLGIDGDGNVLVTEFDNNRVQRFTPEGEFLMGFGEFGIGEGQFIHSNDVAVDDQGRIYVTDWTNHRVQVFDHDGRFLATWGEYGNAEGQFIGPSSVVLDGAGHAYVTDDSGRLQKFRLLPLSELAGSRTA
jgi:DNA-binding beta-propeller fold protein YncE